MQTVGERSSAVILLSKKIAIRTRPATGCDAKPDRTTHTTFENENQRRSPASFDALRATGFSLPAVRPPAPQEHNHRSSRFFFEDADGSTKIAMPGGDQSSYTAKQKCKAAHIEESYEARGDPPEKAAARAWATVNKLDGGGKKSGSGRGRKS